MARSPKKNRGRQKKKSDGGIAVKDIQPNLWDRQSSTTKHLVCLFVLAIVSFAFFAPMHFQGKSLFAFDTVSFKAMSNEMVKYKEETGERALWSPNPFGGMPGYMISTPLDIVQLDDIPRMLRQVIWPSSHFLFLLFGTYLLAFFLTEDRWASVLASIGYGLTTYIPILFVAGHNSKFITMAFAPWLILAFAYALRRPGLLSSLLFAIALSVNLRAGHIQITYYVAFIMGIWWLVEVFYAARGGEGRQIAMATGWLALGSILGIIMVAQPFLSNYEYKAHTIRGASAGGDTGGLSWEYAMNWSQGVGELFTLIISNAYGGSSSTGYWGTKPPTGGPHYVGGIIFLLAVFASVVVKKKEVRALAIATVVMTLFSLGLHFELLNRFMYNYFPLFSSFRVPETWLAMVALTLALLAAYGLKEAVASLRKEGAQLEPVFKAVTAGVVFIVILLTMKTTFFDFERPNDRQQLMQQIARQQQGIDLNDPQVVSFVDRTLSQLKEDRVDQFTGDAIRTLIMLLAAGAVFFLLKRGIISGLIASILIVGLVTYDLATVGRRYFNEEKLVTEKRAEDLVPEYAFDTYLINKKNELGGNGHFRVLSLEGGLVEVARPAFHYETLSGYHGAKLRLYQDYLESILYDGSGFFNSNALDLLNVRYIASPQVLPGTNMAFRDEQTGMMVLERTNVLPRAYFVGDAENVTSSEEAWERIKSPNFDLGNTALIMDEAEVSTSPIDSASTAFATLIDHTPHEISWDVDTDDNRLLVVSEIYYPEGWNAYIDGEQTPIHRVNYLLRGVEVPAGQHEVIMRFEPATYKLSYWLTLGSTLLVYGGVLGLLGMSYTRRKDEEAE